MRNLDWILCCPILFLHSHPIFLSGELFLDVQPFVQSALDGYNISIFAYGQSCSGKTHTLVHIKSLTLSRGPLFNLQFKMKSCANCLFNTILISSYDKYYLEYHFRAQGCTALKPHLEPNWALMKEQELWNLMQLDTLLS